MNHFTRILRKLALASGAALLVAATAPSVWSQDRYPAEPIKLVVPYPAGGSADLIARQFAEQLTKELGQPVLIDNRPGAATNIGADAVVRSKANGYTLLFGSLLQVLNPIFGPAPSFNAGSALEPVSLVARMGFMLAANPKTSFSTGGELLAAAKATPGKLSVSHAQLDLFVDLLGSKASIDLLRVPYKGGAPATTDAIAGQVNMVYALAPVLMPHVQAGKLKALAVSNGKRLDALPNVPTFAELGVDYDISIWYGLLAPAGTPKAIVDRLSAATRKVMALPELAQKVRAAGAEPASSKPEELQAQLHRDTAFWQQVAKTLPSLVQK